MDGNFRKNDLGTKIIANISESTQFEDVFLQHVFTKNKQNIDQLGYSLTTTDGINFVRSWDNSVHNPTIARL